MSKVYCTNSKQFVEQDDYKNYIITGATQKLGSVRCAVLKKNGDPNTYLKPWDAISFVRKQGEKNLNAKLTNQQVRQIVREVYTKSQDEITFISLAEKYNVGVKTISNIAHGRAWRHITVGLINQLKNGNTKVLDSCITASNKSPRKHTKLNPSMAKFIVRDHLINKISVQSLAKKYLMSVSAIRRVVSGKAWSATTIPAIAEFSQWGLKK